jgi:hypothetical protein
MMMELSWQNSTVFTLSLVFGKLFIDLLRRKRNNLHKKWPVIIIDTICSYLQAMKLSVWGQSNDVHSCLDMVIKATGLTDLGGKDSKTFLERYRLSRVLGMERCGCRFTPTGYALAMRAVHERMKYRLLFVEYLKNHPAIEATPLKEPIFVIGFPRTGTTFLHEMLGFHPSVRVHYTWEQMCPVPATDKESLESLEKDRKDRYRTNKTAFNLVMYLAGEDIQSIHRVGYDESEECTTPCAFELPYAISELPLYIFAAKEVIAAKGAGEAFAFYKKFLQLMAWQSSDRRDKDFTWMLKCPFHLPYLEELYQTFPGATVVWTHRDPAECIASACSLYETLLRVFMEESSIDRHALGKAVVEYTRLSLDMALNTFAKYEKKVKVVHIRYADNVKNPKGCLAEICSKVSCLRATSCIFSCVLSWL